MRDNALEPGGGFPLREIAVIRTELPQKFGVPRQSGLVDLLQGRVVFTPPYRVAEAVRGLEQYSHIWLLWRFHQAQREGWSPTVRPPRLGGNKRVGVFATRSPFRPNAIGLSCVRLEKVTFSPAFGPVLHVAGADLVDKTPILDIKPYIPAYDSRPDATAGWTEEADFAPLSVDFPPALLSLIPPGSRPALLALLQSDPRPAYQHDEDRVYGFAFAGCEIKFTVADGTLTVRRVEQAGE